MTEKTGRNISFGLLQDTENSSLLKLLQDNYPQLNWSEPYRKWQYDENPAGKAQSWVARCGGEILGNCTAVPFEIYVKGKVHLAWRIQDVLTQSAYAGLGIYYGLSKLANAFVKNEKYPFNFALPNERSHNGFIRNGWFDAFRIPLRVIPVVKQVRCGTAHSAQRIDCFDESVEQVWTAHARSVDFALHRSSAYLNWRYFKKPQSQYFPFRVRVGSDELIFIMKYYDRENGERWAHLCDLFQSGSQEAVYEIGLQAAVRFAQEHGCKALSAWWPCGRLDDLFSRYQFLPQEDLTRWLVLNSNTLALEDLSMEARWHLTMGDSDVY